MESRDLVSVSASRRIFASLGLEGYGLDYITDVYLFLYHRNEFLSAFFINLLLGSFNIIINSDPISKLVFALSNK